MKRTPLALFALVSIVFCGSAAAQPPGTTASRQGRWTEQQAAAWYAGQPWPVGSNYLPADAENELEMWQASTFDAKRIDTELGWAQSLGMNTMRVFLHDLLWKQDSKGFVRRINTFLEISDKHHIRPIFVLFDSCWDPFPHLGKQANPQPGIHNSRWVQSPGARALDDPAEYPRLEAYVKGVVGAFANDRRILAWDVWNEPDNTNDSSYGPKEPSDKVQRVLTLLPQVFAWARSTHPVQPLTSGVWHGDDWSDTQHLGAMTKEQLEDSDVVSFHSYDPPAAFEKRVQSLAGYHRPLICTEYMARPQGSTFEAILPIEKSDKVGAINWGFVQGRSQTYLPWDSWQHPYTQAPPKEWFHDIFREDGTPYRPAEVAFIRKETGAAQ